MVLSLSSDGAMDTGLAILWGDNGSLSASGAKAFCERRGLPPTPGVPRVGQISGVMKSMRCKIGFTRT
jgi:hypothetical protein